MNGIKTIAAEFDHIGHYFVDLGVLASEYAKNFKQASCASNHRRNAMD